MQYISNKEAVTVGQSHKFLEGKYKLKSYCLIHDRAQQTYTGRYYIIIKTQEIAV